MNTHNNQCHSFQTLLQSHMENAGFHSGSQLAKQITEQCRTSEDRQIRVNRSTIYRWLNGQQVQVRQSKYSREMLLCICKLLSIGSIQEINELLESAGHLKLTLAERQQEFPELPQRPKEPMLSTNLSVPEKPSTTEPSLDLSIQLESCPAESETENPIPVESQPVDIKHPEKPDSHSNFLLVTSALLIFGGSIFIVPQLHSPQSSEFSISILYPQNGQRCPHSVPISGTVTNLPTDKELWVVKEPHRGNYHPDVGPAIVKEEEWRSVAFIGNRGMGADTNLEFLLHIVLASHETGRQFQDYLDIAHKTDSWIGVPTLYDGKIVGSVKVIRDDSVVCTAPEAYD
jgi:hypothetical protein